MDPQHLTVIAAACRDSERIRFAYRSRDGTESRREVEPYALVNLGRRWYLAAWDCGREDWRRFRVDRLARPASTGVRFSRAQAARQGRRRLREPEHRGAPHRYEARVTLQVPADEIEGRVPSTGGPSSRSTTRSCEYRTGDDDLGWLAMRVTMLAVDFVVHEPPELVERLAGSQAG